jgi:phosphatidylglycerol lysyltransferase
MAGASLLIFMGFNYLKSFSHRLVGWLLIIIGAGMFIDPLIPTTCLRDGSVCKEYFSANYLVHAIETFITSSSIFIIAGYDVVRRRRLVSLGFIIFQVSYLGLFLTQLATEHRFNTLAQYVYELALIIWLAWFCRDFMEPASLTSPDQRQTKLIKYAAAAWAFINGISAILISLAHLHLLGKIRGLYFVGDNAWLAQHGVVVGVIMLYLSRHLARGERRARQIFLLILAVETVKYSVITPHPLLMLFYLAGFIGLFVLRDNFSVGVIPLTSRLRLKDALYMVGSLIVAAFLGLAILYRDQRSEHITNKSFEDFFDYTWHTHLTHKPDIDIQSALLAHTISAFLLISIAVILWILFRPYKQLAGQPVEYGRVTDLLKKYSTTPEDYFKAWPRDKKFFWSKNQNGFIAYKISGPIAFALADPISPANQRKVLISEFIDWCRRRRLRACFLPVYKDSLSLYQTAGLESLQIGSSAEIDIRRFLDITAKDKWWRWKKNRAGKNGYTYRESLPPHSPELMEQLRQVSDEWLSFGNHRERSFAMGFFSTEYMDACRVHYLQDNQGKVVAFNNQLPVLKKSDTATIDLFRYRSEAKDPIAFLLFKTIEHLAKDKAYKYFDLGFVPFTASRDPIVRLASFLSRGRFSSRGLEQFKNKFDPVWLPNYLAYDGDLADMALVAMNIESLMDR